MLFSERTSTIVESFDTESVPVIFILSPTLKLCESKVVRS